jgi:hypothetical protein
MDMRYPPVFLAAVKAPYSKSIGNEGHNPFSNSKEMYKLISNIKLKY